MTKQAKNSNHLQVVELPKTLAVEIPLPLLEAFGSIESSFFELCIDSGQQVLQAMMEQDREDLCGPRWKRNPVFSLRQSQDAPESPGNPGRFTCVELCLFCIS